MSASSEMNDQFIVSGIGAAFDVKPHLFSEREHVFVIM